MVGITEVSAALACWRCLRSCSRASAAAAAALSRCSASRRRRAFLRAFTVWSAVNAATAIRTMAKTANATISFFGESGAVPGDVFHAMREGALDGSPQTGDSGHSAADSLAPQGISAAGRSQQAVQPGGAGHPGPRGHAPPPQLAIGGHHDAVPGQPLGLPDDLVVTRARGRHHFDLGVLTVFAVV